MVDIQPDVKVGLRWLLEDYCRCLDARAEDGFEHLWAEDATFDVAGATLRGRSAISEWYSRRQPIGGQSMHVIVAADFDPVSEGLVHGTANFQLLRKGPDRIEVAASGRYDDLYVRSDVTWRFASRRIEMKP